MKEKKILKTTVLAVCGVIAIIMGVPDVGEATFYVTSLRNKEFRLEVSQRENAQTAVFSTNMGEAETYEDACLLPFLYNYAPWRVCILKSIPTKMADLYNDLTSEQIKNHKGNRKDLFSGTADMTPYGSGGPYNKVPYTFVITDGKPIMTEDNKKIDVSKTKFVGTYTQIACIAYYNAALYHHSGAFPLQRGDENGFFVLNDVIEFWYHEYKVKAYREFFPKDGSLQHVGAYHYGEYFGPQIELNRSVVENGMKIMIDEVLWEYVTQHL